MILVQKQSMYRLGQLWHTCAGCWWQTDIGALQPCSTKLRHLCWLGRPHQLQCILGHRSMRADPIPAIST